jgi:acyl-CoA synthetase (AMP-forming)/AMP-acid ligase II
MEAQKFYKGWMYTGDLATWDAEGYVTICGRKDDMIISSGENIYPAQVEEVLNAHPEVEECIVTSVPDPVRGQAVVAYVVPKSPALTVRGLVDYCNSSNGLSPYKRPRFYRLVDSIPYNATGKKLHYVIKEQAARDFEAGLLRRC